MARDLK